MKKWAKILLAVIAIILVVAVIVVVVLKLSGEKPDNTKTKSELKVTQSSDLEALINKMYEGVETLRSLTTTVIDVTDQNIVTSMTGLTSNVDIQSIVVSEPMMSSQAYSVVLVQVKDSKNADKIAKEINEKVNERKWICVGAEKVYTTSSDNVVCLVMSSEEWAKPIYENFKKVAVGINNEYVRTTDQGSIDDAPLGDPIPAL